MGNATHGPIERRLISLISADWVPHDNGTSRGCLGLINGDHRLGCPRRTFEDSPDRGPCIALWIDSVRWCAVLAPVICQGDKGERTQEAAMGTRLAMSQMKAEISRAIATQVLF